MNSAHRVVSSESEELILVDEDDNVTGYLSKAAAHDGQGILHRAFSVFLFDANGRLLLQQRAPGKRLWPGYWSNTCCSHPRRGESMEIATARRLEDELNITAELEFVYRFCYQANYGAHGSENELCHVYLGRSPRDVVANENEISALRFLSVAEVEAALDAQTESMTPWFRMEWRCLRDDHAAQLARFTGS